MHVGQKLWNTHIHTKQTVCFLKHKLGHVLPFSPTEILIPPGSETTPGASVSSSAKCPLPAWVIASASSLHGKFRILILHSTHSLIWASGVDHLIHRFSAGSQLYGVMDRSRNPMMYQRQPSFSSHDAGFQKALSCG